MITSAIPNNYICYSYHAFSVLVEFAFLFLHVIISSVLSRPSVFSQLPTLPFSGQNLLSSNQSSTCFFFCVLLCLPVAFSDLVSHREREESPGYSQKHHCLRLLLRGKRDTPPRMPRAAAPPLLAPPPPTATEAQLQEPRRDRAQSHCHVTEGKKAALAASHQYQPSLYTFFL